MKKNFYTVISMMSGTSMDGTDACLVRIYDDFSHEVLNSHSLEYPSELRKKLMSAAVNNADVSDVCFLNFAVGEHFAECANQLLKKTGMKHENVDFISSHGQTVYHIPKPLECGGIKTASTLQIGDISVIAERTGILTIGDFRTKDIAAGGQGAPLVPFADKILFGKNSNLCIQNIGGISNVTVLSESYPVFAFDNGVGNMLIDYFSDKFFSSPYDKDGNFAKSGHVDQKWLDILMKDEYYSLEPPKTTGREHFNREYAEKILLTAPKNKFDIIRTVTELTAKVIFESYKNFVFPKAKVEGVVIGGGGAYNPVLMNSLKNYFDIPVKTHKDYGIDDKLKEAIAFAILGLHTYLKKPNNIPECTGAKREVVMGKISYPD